MRSRPMPAAALALSFVDAIDRGDLGRLESLLTPQHILAVFDEPPLAGRDANLEAWRGYLQSWPDYVMYPGRAAVRDDSVAILGRTTGSHLGLPDEDELKLALIWVARAEAGAMAEWALVEDTPGARVRLELD